MRVKEKRGGTKKKIYEKIHGNFPMALAVALKDESIEDLPDFHGKTKLIKLFLFSSSVRVRIIKMY